MAKKALKPKLDTAGLVALGAETLAGLLLEAAGGDAVLKRRLNFEIAIAADPAAAAKEIEKRLASLGRSRSFIDYGKSRQFAQELDSLREQIAGRLAARDATRAWELMWSFLGTADTTLGRCDDSSGSIGDVYRDALGDLARIGAAVAPRADVVARIMAAIGDNDYGQYDHLIELMAPVLGPQGLARLRASVEQALAKARAEAGKLPDPDARAHRIRAMTMAEVDALRPRHLAEALRSALKTVTAVQGDVDGYIAAFEPEARRMPGIAADIGGRLLAAGRPAEALAVLDAVRQRPAESKGHDGAFDAVERLIGGGGGATAPSPPVPDAESFTARWPEYNAVRFAVLEALGRTQEAQQGRWRMFERTLAPGWLRDYIARLPDFEDFEAEQRAFDHAGASADIHGALAFLLEWPALERAARLVADRHDTWNGDLYMLLSPAAETLAERYPLAATILRRAMIDETLANGRSTRYGHAARHLRECQGLSSRIADWAPIDDHAAYLERLKRRHGRKDGFWFRVK